MKEKQKTLQDISDEDELRKYLLAELAEDDQARLEERYLRDPDYLELLHAIEAELNDEYAWGELSSRERQRFEERFSNSPAWSERVKFARSLAAHALIYSRNQVPEKRAL